MSNVDDRVADGFGDEWTRFDQRALSIEEKGRIFGEYFSEFPWSKLPDAAVGADFGCGSGRWASVIAHRVGKLFCVDASEAALQVARTNLSTYANCTFVHASVGDLVGITDASLDFAYSLGVLHHIPDTAAGLASCVAKLKPGAPFLVYLYYRFDQRPMWFKALWKLSDMGRKFVSKLPYGLRYGCSQIIAVSVYWPLARLAKIADFAGLSAEAMPLSYYKDKSFYVMRTDALDRFGTRLEQRFTRAEIEKMMQSAGLENISFSDNPPYWCAVGTKKRR
jgi:SAM-dependent methyltransferase